MSRAAIYLQLPRAAYVLQMQHREAQSAIGVSWAHFASQAHLSKENIVCMADSRLPTALEAEADPLGWVLHQRFAPGVPITEDQPRGKRGAP